MQTNVNTQTEKKNPIKIISINCIYFNITRGSCAVVHFRIENERPSKREIAKKKYATRTTTNKPIVPNSLCSAVQNLLQKYQAKKFSSLRLGCNVFEFKRN